MKRGNSAPINLKLRPSLRIYKNTGQQITREGNETSHARRAAEGNETLHVKGRTWMSDRRPTS